MKKHIVEYFKIIFIIFILALFIFPIIFVCTNTIFIISYMIFVIPLIDVICDWYIDKYIL